MCDICKQFIGPTEDYLFSSIPIHIGGNKYEMQIGSCEMTIEYWNNEDWGIRPPFTLSLQFCLGPEDACGEIEASHTEIHYCPICGQKLDELLKGETK